MTWQECHVQVNRYSSALYKSYDSYDGAENALRTYIDNEDLVRDVQRECEVTVHENQPPHNLRGEDAMDIPLTTPKVVGCDDQVEGDCNVGNYLMRLPASCIDQVDLVKIIFFWKKQYFSIKAMLKTRMFAWNSTDSCVIDEANKFARTHCIDPCPLFEKKMEVFDVVSPEERGLLFEW
ncbi:unnamed protein product [Ilex paraguariensis]|uniref:Ribonuclease H1 N-terminal domain-containing protein n=1 Tax=Ilex paraguariensis TaxID=185542 RepID=A0ABC8TIJ6_9AQUA